MLIPLRLSAQSDEQLMQHAARGSNRAFEELYKRYARRLQGFFARRLGEDADLAADFMHDTFLRLYAARENYREGLNFRTWLYTIAYNLCRNHHRNQFAMVSDEGVDIIDEGSIEVELDMQSLHNVLREVLHRLPEPYAILFSLHYEEELTVPQIAQISRLPEGTVKSRLHKAMNIIKQQLKRYEDK